MSDIFFLFLIFSSKWQNVISLFLFHFINIIICVFVGEGSIAHFWCKQQTKNYLWFAPVIKKATLTTLVNAAPDN